MKAAGVRGTAPRRAGVRLGGVPVSRDGKIVALQRARLLSAAVGLLAERGYGSFSAAALCVRAGVSRRTFYEIFEDRDACLLAILGDTEALVARELERLDLERVDWRERVRLGLWTLLCIAEENPALARVCLIECQRAGGQVQQAYERIVQQLIAVVDEGRALRIRNATVGALTAEALVGAALSIITARLAGVTRQGSSGPVDMDLRGLLGELTSMIALPYRGAAAARREITCPLPHASIGEDHEAIAAFEGPDPLSGLQMRFTYRTARVLLAVDELTSQRLEVSNRLVAERAGVSDPGQISKLLARLQKHGLLKNAATGGRERGEANQWRLTPTGIRVLQSTSRRAERKSGVVAPLRNVAVGNDSFTNTSEKKENSSQ